MIEQQYYTRERGGLFNQTDGYDTVAKSPQLKLEYIKKNLHPLCSYDIPQELQKTGEKDESKYPPNFMVVPMESGETVVGRAIYKNRDFTGLRSTFFMHNFVLSAKERRRYIKEPEKLFGITGFADHYTFGEGKELPTLAAIPYEVSGRLLESREQLFLELGIEESVFHQMIEAAFTASYTRKKVFIVLNVSIEQLGMYSKALLYHLYKALPWSVAETLGISTYSGKAEARKNIQITFLDKYTLWNDSRLNKEYIFDFATHRFLNVNAHTEEESYIKIALKYIGNKPAWERYNQLADELAAAIKSAGVRDMRFYGRAAQLLEMDLYSRKNRIYELSSSMREGLMKELLDYCRSRLSEETTLLMCQLMEYTIGLLHGPINRGILWSMEEVKVLLEYKLHLMEKSKDQFLHCEQVILCLLGEAVKERKEAYEDDVLKEAECFLTFYQSLYEQIYSDKLLKVRIGYRRIEDSLSQVSVLEQLMDKMKGLEKIEPVLFSDAYYEEAVIHKFQQVISNTANKVYQLEMLQGWCKLHSAPLYQKLRRLGEQHFLEEVDISREIPSGEVLCRLQFAQEYEGDNYRIISTYQRLNTDITAMNPGSIHIDPQVQALIRQFYRQSGSKEKFYLLVYAFLKENAEGELKLQLEKVLAYLKTIDDNLMFEFILWSKGQEMYIDKGRYDEQVVHFFLRLKEKKERVSSDKIKEKLGVHRKTQLLAGKIIRAQQSGFDRFMTEHRRSIIAGALMVIAAGSVGAGVYWHNEKEGQTVLEQRSMPDEWVIKLYSQLDGWNEVVGQKSAESAKEKLGGKKKTIPEAEKAAVLEERKNGSAGETAGTKESE